MRSTKKECTVKVVQFMLLSVVVAITASDLFAANPQALDPMTERAAAQGIEPFLDESGRLILPEGYKGGLDPAGFEMHLDEDGTPRFVSETTGGGAANPNDRWANEFALPNGCDGTVYATAVSAAGELYLGGDFGLCGDVVANNIIRYDPATQIWSALGSGAGNGVNGRVYALAVSDDELYVGGMFSQANFGDPIVANRIALWDGSSWSAVGNGTGNGVNSTVLALATLNGDLYAGGWFTEVNTGEPLSANRIARWDGSAWLTLGSGSGNGVNSSVRALVSSGNNLYVGGEFTQANVGDAISANRIARWDGTNWSALGSSGGNGVDNGVTTLAVLDGDLFVGGNSINQANVGNPVSTNRLARWDGSSWSPLGNGVNGPVRSLAALGGDLYVGGVFIAANTWSGGSLTFTNRIARWDGNGWSALGSGAGNGVSGTVESLAVVGSDLYAGGDFGQSNIGSQISTNHIARWDSSDWSALGSSTGVGVNSSISALAVSGNYLYVAGSFTAIGETEANRIARWDGYTWSALGSGSGNGVNGGIRAIAVSGSNVYVGGDFSQANIGDAIGAGRVALWDGSSWSALGSGGGNGIGGTVTALAVFEDDLYVGGAFAQANVGNPISTMRIARWDGSDWSAVGSGAGNGVNNTVTAITVWDGNLYAGGYFTEVNVGDPVAANHIARWDGSNWSTVGSGAGNGVDLAALALESSDAYLFVGGVFTEANVGDPIPTNAIARWDGSNWSALDSQTGNGVNGAVLSLAISGVDLYVGGHFTLANTGDSITANRIAKWNGSDWTALGSGLSRGVRALALADLDTIYAGGDFVTAGDKPSSHLARYTTRGNLAVALMGAGTGSVESTPAGIDCTVACSAMYSWDQTIELTATPEAGSEFIGWSGAGCSGTGSCVIDFEQDTTVSAEFELSTYSIGGEVFGLEGGQVVLQNNGSDNQTINADGSFSFPPQYDGTGYEVTVLIQPSDPSQTCTVANGTGTLAGADVTNVEVTCTTDQFTVGGNVTGLVGDQVVLQNMGTDNQVVTENGPFTFSPQVDDSAYEVTVLTQPGNPNQTCSVANGSGNLSGANITNVDVNCTTNQYTVGGTVTGLLDNQVVLQNEGGDDQVMTANGGFAFSPQNDGTSYAVTVATQPSDPSQTCTVANGSGTLAGEDVTNIDVTCTTDQFTVGGTVVGLEGDQVVLQNNGGDDQTLTVDGGFIFSPQDDGTDFQVTVASQPSTPQQICNVINGSGTLASADITDVQVICGGSEIFNDRFELE